jgi:hypothetical protein
VFFPRPHVYLWLDRTAAVRESRPVQSGAALVWERGGVVLRLEGEARREVAIGLGASVR